MVRGGHSAQVVGDVLIAAFSQLPAGLRTLTWEGKEMFHHARIEQAIDFADPHSPWRRGTNENTACFASTSPKVPT